MTAIWPDRDALCLLTDLYELTMAQAYWHQQRNDEAIFSLFFRVLPEQRQYAVACGQEYAAHLVSELRFPEVQVARLAELKQFQPEFLDWLAGFRFTGEIRTVPEGTLVFPHEPVLEVRAPVIQGQLLESLLMNYINLETLLASKASRVVDAAGGRPVMDFGMRRMHGLEAAWRGVRAYRVAGISGTSNVLASRDFDLPAQGTMAHSYIQAVGDERQAFLDYARLYPGTTLLVDTYDTLAAVDKVIGLVRDEGIEVGAIRIDSGDLGALAKAARQRLDNAGLSGIRVVVSGGLDEWKIAKLVEGGAPMDGFGVGTEMGSVADAPSLDFAYKLTEYGGEPRLKNAPGKPVYPGAKQVWRQHDANGMLAGDEIRGLAEPGAGEPLLRAVIRDGRPVLPLPDPDQARERLSRERQSLPAALRGLTPQAPYPVRFSEALETLRRDTLARLTN
ncbi:Nicotinate phosphoribosyltransferase pncB2 [Alloalcanivorax dieselolei B5]|uniref:Nicotinate phosphoribosyltransferase n=1 Tax=Alcanivorax dieselolei (strain DSM 16502 / CGMCC 1.3690 / MCCC 1A00001 / B-5) TaxID=930169 RepID=K0C6U8_ALCDB|nr:nicotinate phosphoribosyltransferase [Alloalcanivorax dieselolei]AFT69204.1 Nicotinate phosphoribosyltransferase pncB2 [Alloalcanivorax dieselolei B5]GGJ83342.1 nicotinate phosphoribosyltransferase [Alloalcanivorax dieselolei]